MNITLPRNKYDNKISLKDGNPDFNAPAKTKIEHSFPTPQFTYTEYKRPYHWGFIACLEADVPSRQISSSEIPSDIQVLTIELNFKEQKWCIFFIYKPPL